MNKGDYVLATKYNDGEAWDHWAVGFYNGMAPQGDRHYVVDENGQSFRFSGFRKCAIIDKALGLWFMTHAEKLEKLGCNLWRIKRLYEDNSVRVLTDVLDYEND